MACPLDIFIELLEVNALCRMNCTMITRRADVANKVYVATRVDDQVALDLSVCSEQQISNSHVVK